MFLPDTDCRQECILNTVPFVPFLFGGGVSFGPVDDEVLLRVVLVLLEVVVTALSKISVITLTELFDRKVILLVVAVLVVFNVVDLGVVDFRDGFG